MSKQSDVLVPKLSKPIRVIFLFESTSGWYSKTNEFKHEHILPVLDKVLNSWEDNGSTLIGTIDADVLASGKPTKLGWHACFLYDVPTVELISEMIHSFREKELDRYFRIEAIIGRKFKLLEK